MKSHFNVFASGMIYERYDDCVFNLTRPRTYIYTHQQIHFAEAITVVHIAL